MVETSKIVGNELNSKGVTINSDVINTMTEKVNEILSEISKSHVGIGMMRTSRIEINPSAKATSPRFVAAENRSNADKPCDDERAASAIFLKPL